LPVAPVTQRLAQLIDVVGEISFFHKAVGPDLPQQILFGKQPPPALNQHEKQLRSLGRELNDVAVAQQRALPGIRIEGPNLYKRFVSRAIRALTTRSELYQN